MIFTSIEQILDTNEEFEKYLPFEKDILRIFNNELIISDFSLEKDVKI